MGQRVVGPFGVGRNRPHVFALIGRLDWPIGRGFAYSSWGPAIAVKAADDQPDPVLAYVQYVISARVVDFHLRLDLDLISHSRHDAPLGDVDPSVDVVAVMSR